MPQFKLGFENKLCVGSAGALPSTELKTVTNVQVELSSAEVDVTARQSGAFKVYIPGMIDPSLSFDVNADVDDTVFATIRSAYIGRTAVAVKCELGDGYYFASDMIVTKCSNDQNTEDASKYSVTMRPTITTSSFAPQITSGGSGAQV